MNATNSWASNFRRNEEAEDTNQACLARTIPTRPKNRRNTLLIVASKRADIPLRAAARDNSRMGTARRQICPETLLWEVDLMGYGGRSLATEALRPVCPEWRNFAAKVFFSLFSGFSRTVLRHRSFPTSKVNRPRSGSNVRLDAGDSKSASTNPRRRGHLKLEFRFGLTRVCIYPPQCVVLRCSPPRRNARTYGTVPDVLGPSTNLKLDTRPRLLCGQDRRLDPANDLNEVIRGLEDQDQASIRCLIRECDLLLA